MTSIFRLPCFFAVFIVVQRGGLDGASVGNVMSVVKGPTSTMAPVPSQKLYPGAPSSNGWAVIQQRLNNPYSTKTGTYFFDGDLNAYTTGFGDPTGNYWMGLNKINGITNRGNYRLRIDLYLIVEQVWVSSQYESFSVDSNANNYALHASGNSGMAGDVLNVTNNAQAEIYGLPFSTSDDDNTGGWSCPTVYGGGWWFNEDDCYSCDLNKDPDNEESIDVFVCAMFNRNEYIAQSRMLIQSTTPTMNLSTTPANTLAHEGDPDVILQCAGDPTANFYWTFTPFTTFSGEIVDYVLTDNDLVRPTHAKTYGVQQKQPNHSDLIVFNATMATAGTYRCLSDLIIPGFIYYDDYYATYDNPTIVIAVAQLIVIDSDPICTSQGSQEKVGDSVKLSCTFSYAGGTFESELSQTYPTSNNIDLTLTWSSNGKTINSGIFQSLTFAYSLVTLVSTLTVAVSGVSQTYECQATFSSPSFKRPGVAVNAPTYDQSCTSVVAPQNMPTTAPPMNLFAGAPSSEGWTLIHQRINNPLVKIGNSMTYYFNRQLADYQNGFGNPSENYWMGLDQISRITYRGSYSLRIDMYLTVKNTWVSAQYESFVVDPAENNYILNVEGNSGTAGDVLNMTNTFMTHNNVQFSTTDGDSTGDVACPSNYGGGWWFNPYTCYCCDLTKNPQDENNVNTFDCTIRGEDETVEQSRMLIQMINQSDSITRAPVNTWAHQNDENIVLQCSGDPDLNFYWTVTPFTTIPGECVDYVLTSNGVVKTNHAQFYQVENEQPDEFNLIILNASEATAGTYRCINDVTIIEFVYDDYYYETYDNPNMVVAVAQFMVIVSDPVCNSNETRAIAGQTVALTCSISYSGGSFETELSQAYPTSNVIQPVIAWSSGGKSLGKGMYQVVTLSYSLVTVVSALTVRSTTAASQSYECNIVFGPPTSPQLGTAKNVIDYNEKCNIAVQWSTIKKK